MNKMASSSRTENEQQSYSTGEESEVESGGLCVKYSLSDFIDEQLSNAASSLLEEEKLGIRPETMSPKLAELLLPGAPLHRSCKNADVSHPIPNLFREDDEAVDEDEDFSGDEELVSVQYLNKEWESAAHHSEPILHLRQEDAHTESARALKDRRPSRVRSVVRGVRSMVNTIFGVIGRTNRRKSKGEDGSKIEENEIPSGSQELDENLDHKRLSRKKKYRQKDKGARRREKQGVKKEEGGDFVVRQKTSFLHRIRNSARNLAVRVQR